MRIREWRAIHGQLYSAPRNPRKLWGKRGRDLGVDDVILWCWNFIRVRRSERCGDVIQTGDPEACVRMRRRRPSFIGVNEIDLTADSRWIVLRLIDDRSKTCWRQQAFKPAVAHSPLNIFPRTSSLGQFPSMRTFPRHFTHLYSSNDSKIKTDISP